MEGPISKFMQQQESFWPTPFSPDLIELNSDSERNVKPVEPLNYSSSQDEVETEDDDAEETAIMKDDEESCHLLQTEDSDNSDSEHEHYASDSHSSSNGGSSDSPSDKNPPIPDHISYESFPYPKIWSMTTEQRDYYTQQFLQLQPDISGLISGEVAKPFFEKSRLPLDDLRNIWQLADVTEDGYLDLNEFRLAMHFVVVRKHNLPLPSDFGESRRNSLVEQARDQEHTKASRVGSNSSGSTQAPVNNGKSVQQPEPLFDEAVHEQLTSLSELSLGASVKLINSPAALPSSCNMVPGHTEKLNLRAIQKSSKEEWTTFDNEPVNFSSICDKNGLVAPVPVRLTTPEENSMTTHTNAACGSAPKNAQQLQLKSIQRPKLSGQHPKNGAAGTIAPPPPPRRKTHVRSSSLDLNRLTISSDLQSNLNGPDVTGRNFLSPSHPSGAFSIYRKPAPKSEVIHEPRNELSDFRQFRRSIETTVDELRVEVDELRNDSIILTRITTQLLEQLSWLQAKRKYLTFQLHQVSAETSAPPAVPGNSHQT